MRSRSESPGSAPSVAAPAASSTVGAMSMCLTGVSITTPRVSRDAFGLISATMSGTWSVAS